MVTDTKAKTTELPLDPRIREMMELGLHFVHKTSTINPQMLTSIDKVSNTIHDAVLPTYKHSIN